MVEKHADSLLQALATVAASPFRVLLVEAAQATYLISQTHIKFLSCAAAHVLPILGSVLRLLDTIDKEREKEKKAQSASPQSQQQQQQQQQAQQAAPASASASPASAPTVTFISALDESSLPALLLTTIEGYLSYGTQNTGSLQERALPALSEEKKYGKGERNPGTETQQILLMVDREQGLMLLERNVERLAKQPPTTLTAQQVQRLQGLSAAVAEYRKARNIASVNFLTSSAAQPQQRPAQAQPQPQQQQQQAAAAPAAAAAPQPASSPAADQDLPPLFGVGAPVAAPPSVRRY